MDACGGLGVVEREVVGGGVVGGGSVTVIIYPMTRLSRFFRSGPRAGGVPGRAGLSGWWRW
jgi:hypothetical protein